MIFTSKTKKRGGFLFPQSKAQGDVQFGFFACLCDGPIKMCLIFVELGIRGELADHDPKLHENQSPECKFNASHVINPQKKSESAKCFSRNRTAASLVASLGDPAKASALFCASSGSS